MRSIKLSGLMMIAAALMLSTAGAVAGSSLPKLKLKDLNGQKENLQADQDQAKIIVLNFWATWCGPCNEEMPMLVQEQAKYKGRGVQVIGVSLDKSSDEGKVRDFIAKYHINFPIWVGGTGDDVGRWKLGPAVPATAFIQDGKVVGRVWGEMRQPSFEHRIEWLLGNHEGTPPKAVENNLDVKEK
jgi:thiol-disulfide isomerase/thioredoxin